MRLGFFLHAITGRAITVYRCKCKYSSFKCIYVCICIYIYVCVDVCICMYIYVCVYVCICIYIYVCVDVYMYVYIYIRMCRCVYM